MWLRNLSLPALHQLPLLKPQRCLWPLPVPVGETLLQSGVTELLVEEQTGWQSPLPAARWPRDHLFVRGISGAQGREPNPVHLQKQPVSAHEQEEAVYSVQA